jgi:hypothetical protein
VVPRGEMKAWIAQALDFFCGPVPVIRPKR